MMAETPIVLRHRDALNQAMLFGAFVLLLLAIPTIAFIIDASPKWWLLVLLPLALLAGYAALRLVTLRVVLDENGVGEPAPVWPMVLTPWDDVVRVRRSEEKGAIGLSFLGVMIEHKGGWKHQVAALNMNTRDPLADKTIDEWLAAIREAKRRYTA
ncbi:MAG: hypothetical protein MUP36_02600 [Demequinaceae bacterium]|nr:hypothetical protein [Demequinaceae bacterium]